MNDYADRTSGALFTNTRKQKSNHPDFTGNMTFSKDLLRQMVDIARAGGEIKLSISGWDKTSKAGNRFISLNASVFREREDKASVPFNDDPF
jgi:hypothetical protein